jgi:8-oxo-dGTP diphosphatase
MATEWRGEATETAEAVPLWTPIGSIPYDEMWEDDRHWLPRMLGGETFLARFIFEHERIVCQEIEFGVDWNHR